MSRDAPKLRTVRAYMRPVRSSRARARILALYRTSCAAAGLAPYGPGWGEARRNVLQTALFGVENAIESRGGGRPNHPTVLQVHAARMLVERDLGWEV